MKIKKIVLIALSIVVFALQSFADTWHVYNGASIQNVITNLAVHGDGIHVHSYSPSNEYAGFDFEGKDLDILGQGNPRPIINGGNSQIVIDMTSIYNPSAQATPELKNFKIIGASAEIGVKLTNLTGLKAKIENNIIDGIEKAIYVGDNQNSIKLYWNELLNNDYAYYSIETSANQGFPDDFNYNIVYDNDYGLYLGNLSNTGALGNSFYNNDTGIFLQNSVLVINSSIIYGNDTQIDNDNGYVTVTYSDIEDGYIGTGNIDDDPLFCFEYPYGYYLLEGSPCIDTGDPTRTDLDGTRLDMGWRLTDTDIKYCEGNHWNWVSFPRLDRDDDDAVDAPPILDDFLDWPFDLELLYINLNPVLEYTNSSSSWYPTSYYVKSSLGYKLDPQDNGDHYLPSQNGATRLPADWELRDTLPRNTDNWMGYWLPWTQNIEDAFGEFWESVVSVEAEDWYYEYSIYETPTSSTTNKNMVYGKAYIVVFGEDIEEFYWTDDMEETEQRERMESEYFSYNDLPSYEVIDVMDIPQNVLEIGVFEDDVCVGAVVVQDTCEQILVYSSNVLRDPIPFSFEIVTYNRETGVPITSYQVLNKETGIYESRSLISGQQKSSIIMFGNLEDPQNETPVIDNVVLHGNYPNPFNPET
ncbi:MAG: hypothetical protein HQ534_03055, partial [Armatimonadetes bacterium]|nr:hypothetical protein [Armatimonadota bacterium]